MCTQMTQNGRIIVPGSRAIVRPRLDVNRVMTWGNTTSFNARLESLENIWKPRGFLLGSMMVDSFVEADTGFEFKKPLKVAIIYKQGIFLVVTEPANKQVARVHPRQPCFEHIKQLLVA